MRRDRRQSCSSRVTPERTLYRTHLTRHKISDREPVKRDSKPKGGWQTFMKWIADWLAVRWIGWLDVVME